VGVVPELTHFAVYHDNVVETYENVLHGGFDSDVATVLDETFCENLNAIHAMVVVHRCKFDHVKTTSTQRAGMHGPVTVSRGNDCPPHNWDMMVSVVVVSIVTKVKAIVSIATKITATPTVDIDTTTNERFTNGRFR